MEYLEYDPWPELAAFISVVWTLEGEAGGMDEDAQPVLPDGQPEIVLHFGDPFVRVNADGRIEPQPGLLFAGQLTERLILRPTGRIAVLGIRFRPFGAAALLRVAQHELAGLTPGLDTVSPELSRALDQVRSMTGELSDAVWHAQGVLSLRVQRSAVDPRVSAAVDAIRRSGGVMAMDDVARHAAITRRHMERRFLEQVGIPPKRLARIARFQRALRILEAVDSSRRGAETAADCGYADQSHFIRDFRDLAGCSPAQHLLRRGELTGFFISDPSRPRVSPSPVL